MKCEAEQSVLEEQLSYMLYMDKEYNVRPWKAPKDIGVVVGDSDKHPAIKDKLDSEVSIAPLWAYATLIGPFPALL